MDFSIGQVREAIQRARQEVVERGVTEDTDVITATLAALRLFQQSQEHRPSNAATGTTPIQFPETFAEWTANYSLASHNDQFLAAMMYLWEKEQMQSFITDDIVQLYKKARWEMPKNPADVMGKAANRHYIAEAATGEDGKKHWQLTKTGYEYLQNLRKENNDGK